MIIDTTGLVKEYIISDYTHYFIARYLKRPNKKILLQCGEDMKKHEPIIIKIGNNFVYNIVKSYNKNKDVEYICKKYEIPKEFVIVILKGEKII